MAGISGQLAYALPRTKAEFDAQNAVWPKGVLLFTTDTTDLYIGDGVTAFTSLDAVGSAAASGALLAANDLSDLDSASTARTNLDVFSKEEVQEGTGRYAVATGSSSAYVVALTPAITAYTDGMVVSFRANHTSDSNNPALDAGGGAEAIEYNNGRTVSSGFIVSGGIYTVQWSSNAAAWIMLSGVVPLVGTFSPVLAATSTDFDSVTYNGSVRTGRYVAVDVGDGEVQVDGSLRMGTTSITKGSASGNITVSVPFTLITGINSVAASTHNASGFATDTPNSALGLNATATFQLLKRASANGADSNLAVADIATGSGNGFTITFSFRGVAP